jgi:LacI family transcriptional regulator/LacI family repressor for deo operon, udp, cdd, tsx, nupC, and nupG
VNAPKRITQQDIARAAGVSRGAVSLALSGHPSISGETRDRINKIAIELGYAPDPMLTALASYRHGRRPAEFRGTLAWLAQTTETFDWRTIAHFAAYLEAARTRAEFHGYRIEVLDLQEMGISWSRAATIAKSRGIDGVLLCPQPYSYMDLADFPWSDFAAVTFGYSIANPKLHSVAPAQYRASFNTMKELLARGYQRIGFALNSWHDQRTDHNYLAGYLTAWELHNPSERIPPCVDNDVGPWMKQYRPDAVITGDVRFLEKLAELGLSAPKDLGVACPLLDSPANPMAGVWEDNHQIGRAAVDFLVSLLHQGERGVPPHPQRLLVEGMWGPGRTLRPLPSD